MTDARVFIDDFATGALPGRCVKTGRPTDTVVVVDQMNSGFHPAWILLLALGPVGIVGLAILWALGRRRHQLSGLLPMAPEAFAERNDWVRVSRRAWWASVVGLGVGVGLLIGRDQLDAAGPFALASALVVAGALVVVLVAGLVARSHGFDARLDGSGRWVVLRRVHPDFAAAVRAHYRTHRDLADGAPSEGA